MSDTVVPRTFPYRPSGGFTNDDIWTGSSGPGHDDIPDGMTAESKDRLKQIGFSALDSVLEAFQYKIRPQTPDRVERAPGDPSVANAGMGPEVPIRITGKAPQISRAGMAWGIGIAAFLVVALLFEGRKAAA